MKPLLGELGVEVLPGPPPTACPRDEEEVRQVLRHAASSSMKVVPIGTGGRLPWCRPEASRGSTDLLLSTSALDQVLDYVPGDGTLTAQAGCTMAQLSETVSAGGHLLTPAVPAPEQATLGGTLAAGHSGLDRVRHGPVRHHVLGMKVMLADGTTPSSGGKLVKNVTGFDLHRLYTGSRGTLCVILEASLRLFPIPERVLHLTWSADSFQEQLGRSRALRALPLQPLEHLLTRTPEGWHLHLSLAGLDVQVDAEFKLVLGAAARPDEVLEDSEAGPERARLRDLERADGWPQLSMTGRPSEVERMVESLEALGATRLLVTPGVAQAQAWIPGLEADGDVGRRLRFLRRYERGVGLRVEARDVSQALHQELSPRAGEAPGLPAMLDLRHALDPDGRFTSPIFPGQA